MESIEKHIEKDRKIAEDPLASPAARRHAKVELEELETYAEHHKEEIEAGDHHDPNALEPVSYTHLTLPTILLV